MELVKVKFKFTKKSCINKKKKKKKKKKNYKI